MLNHRTAFWRTLAIFYINAADCKAHRQGKHIWIS
jgi:hypothetical protein